MNWFKRAEPNIRDALTSVPKELENLHKYTQRQYETQNKIEFEQRVKRQRALTKRPPRPSFSPTMTTIREGGRRTRKRFR